MATRDKLIQVTDLKKHYKMGTIKALDGVTTDIYRGDVMVVIGPSGSGKSTFLRSLNLLEEPTGGAIIFDGVDITKKKYKDADGKTVKLDIDALRQKMGMVFQHFNVFPNMSVGKNITMSPVLLKKKTQKEADEMAKELLNRVGLLDKINEYPGKLSGGQKQRVASQGQSPQGRRLFSRMSHWQSGLQDRDGSHLNPQELRFQVWADPGHDYPRRDHRPDGRPHYHY